MKTSKIYQNLCSKSESEVKNFVYIYKRIERIFQSKLDWCISQTLFTKKSFFGKIMDDKVGFIIHKLLLKAVLFH